MSGEKLAVTQLINIPDRESGNVFPQVIMFVVAMTAYCAFLI